MTLSIYDAPHAFCVILSVSLHQLFLFFFNDTATTEIYTLSLHDALPISICCSTSALYESGLTFTRRSPFFTTLRSEEHTSELQSRVDLVCRLLLEKKKKTYRQFECRSTTKQLVLNRSCAERLLHDLVGGI